MTLAELTRFTTFHRLTPADAATTTAMRAAMGPVKGLLRGTAGREPFAAIMGHTPAAAGVTYDPATISGVAGWWCRPKAARPGAAVLYLHGGAFVMGSALTHRPLAGHVAARARTAVFVADYRLAPEHQCPAAVLDAEAAYHGLTDAGFTRVALAGDSAGGGLALAALARATARAATGAAAMPVGAVVLSPWVDLALAGASWVDRDAADPYFTRPQVADFARLYLGDQSPTDPAASPLYGDLAGLPPVRAHVGQDEVLLDDAKRYVQRAVAVGVDARVDVWEGMAHVFPSAVGRLAAADAALDAIGTFLAERLETGHA